MARKKRHPEHQNHERWLVSYADFITLLFAFFVVMFASSQTDKGKQQQMAESMKNAIEQNQIASAISGILGGTADDKGKGNAQMRGPGGSNKIARDEASKLVELAPAVEYLNKALEAEIKDGKMTVSLQPRGLVVSMNSAAFFYSGVDEVNEDAYDSVSKVAATIRDLPNQIRLEGHTDSKPIRTPRFRGNWELSAARAISMMELFTTRFEIPKSRVAIAGYADTAPIETNDTEEGRAANRRVDVVILNHLGLQSEPGAANRKVP